MIETIINEPKALVSNSSAVVFDGIGSISKSTPCCNGGWLSYQNGSPLFKILEDKYTGRYFATFSATISSAVAGTIAFGLYIDGILIPDTVRAVTLAAADDLATISFSRELPICPRSTTTLTVQSVPTVATPTDPTTPITTEIPIIVAGSFRLGRP